jgi:hypothetical protein
MINSPVVEQAVNAASLGVEELVPALLGRLPTDREKVAAAGCGAKDIAWALLNTSEFMFER